MDLYSSTTTDHFVSLLVAHLIFWKGLCSHVHIASIRSLVLCLNIHHFFFSDFQERNEDPSGSKSSRSPTSGTQTPEPTSSYQSSGYGLFTRRLSGINTSILLRTQSLGGAVLQHVRPGSQQSWNIACLSPLHNLKHPPSSMTPN